MLKSNSKVGKPQSLCIQYISQYTMHENLFKMLRNTPLIQNRQMISITLLSFKKNELIPIVTQLFNDTCFEKCQFLQLQSKVNASSNIESAIAKFGPLTIPQLLKPL